jgi:antitoxin YefM
MDDTYSATFFIAVHVRINWAVAVYCQFSSLETARSRFDAGSARVGPLPGHQVDVGCVFDDQTLRCAFFSPHSQQPSSILAPVHVQVKDSRENQVMKIVTYSEARSSLKAVLDNVHDDADVTVISRRDGADAVVMSFDYYQSIMATMHLLASPANAAHLATSIAQHKAGKAVRRALAKA